MRHFCTLFNSAYQFHARILYKSICEHVDIDKFKFYFFCFDQDSYDYFRDLKLRNATLVSLEELEHFLPELKAVKPERSMAEYFFTSTPAICKYVMEKYSDVDEIVYLDADLFFFQSPEIVFSEIGSSSISIIPHRFNLFNYIRNIYGYYNVGWISFKKDEDGTSCLNQWYQDNIEWCFDRLTFKRYADQKYLNYWKRDFKNVHVIKHRGANVAHWNVGNYKVHLVDSAIFVDNVPLIFYHFASLKFIDKGYYTTISSYFSSVTPAVTSLIYRPYITRLRNLGFTPRVSVRLNKNPFIRRMRKIIRNFYNDTITVEN